MIFDVEVPNAREGISSPSGSIYCGDIADLAVFAEQLGFDGVWVNDFITPTPCYGVPETETPAWHEPIVTLAYLAALTKKVTLGTAVIMAPFRDPIILAKELATLDRFSNGRVRLGLGIGMCRDELAMVRPREQKMHRGRHLDEFTQALQALLAHQSDPVSFKGEYVEFEGLKLDPKPVSRTVPIYMPGRGDDQLARIARLGLNPMIRAASAPAQFDKLKAIMETEGRDPGSVDLIAEVELRIAATDEEAVAQYRQTRLGKVRTEVRKMPIDQLVADNWIGSTETIIAKVDALRAKGVRHFSVLNIAADTPADRREQMQAFAEQVMSVYR